jgi:hypothetical protein
MNAIWEKVQTLFSPPGLAALRNVLMALAGVVGTLGIAGLSQSKLQPLIDAVMSVGTATATLITAIAVAALKSTMASQRKSVSLQPHTVVVQAASADGIIAAANAVAAIPDVQQVTSSPRVADATVSEKVVAAANAK